MLLELSIELKAPRRLSQAFIGFKKESFGCKAASTFCEITVPKARSQKTQFPA